LGATGERTDLNRGGSHAPIRSHSTVSVGGGDTTLDGQTMYGTTFAIESAAADRVCASYRTLPLTKNDIEFTNGP
jgi:N-formylglutamate amidohydrolase